MEPVPFWLQPIHFLPKNMRTGTLHDQRDESVESTPPTNVWTKMPNVMRRFCTGLLGLTLHSSAWADTQPPDLSGT